MKVIEKLLALSMMVGLNFVVWVMAFTFIKDVVKEIRKDLMWKRLMKKGSNREVGKDL